MKTFKISKINNEVSTVAKLNNPVIVTSGNDLCLIINRQDGLELIAGGKIKFEKYASGNSGQMILVCEEDAPIKTIVEEGDKKYVYFEYVYIKPLTVASFLNITSTDHYNYKFYFTTPHNMVADDLIERNAYKIYVRRGQNVLEFSDLAFCYPNELVKGENIIRMDGECCIDITKRFNYETMERDSILAKTKRVISGSDFKPEYGDQVLFETNPYFHVEGNNAVLFSNVNVCKYTDFMGLGIVLEQDYDAKRMFQEYQVNELYVNKIKRSIIPDFIDLEKVKYAPAFFEEIPNDETEDPDDVIVKMFLATGLTFNLHFRTRVSGSTTEGGLIDEDTAKYTFEDTWHLSDVTETWNGNGVDRPTIKREDLYDDEEFVNSSNLIGYLGFTDEDVYNQKNRIKKTFIRLSFYDSKDPLTQNLLYYSTIFLDSGDLFGKFVKRKAWLSEDEDYDEALNPVVWSSASTSDPCSAVTCQMMVNDEYDMTRSGEGFNLYLFRADAPIENELQNIYMKVEFNHAGYGRTVPLIRWPKELGADGKESLNGNARKLTMGTYLDALYIPIQITLTDMGYVYSFPNAISAEDDSKGGRKNGIVWENERLVLNLFEPMIEPDWIAQE